MAGIDKIAIVFSIAIALVGVGIAVAGIATDSTPTYSAPVSSTPIDTTPMDSTKTLESETQKESFGDDIAEKVKSGMDMMEKEAVELEEKIMMDKTMMDKTMMDKTTGPTTHTVDIPVGTSISGCEKKNACYTPADITINAGDTVEWINIDTAAHTVTGGSPADGPSDVFDSSLIGVDATFVFTFDDADSYEYFCMVHPWMTGSVTVN